MAAIPYHPNCARPSSRALPFQGLSMRYTVNYGSAKEPERVEMVHVGPHEAVHAEFAAANGLREWGETHQVVQPRKTRRRAA